MLLRLLTVLSATAVVAGSMTGGAPATASASASASARDAFSLAAPSRFSPNGDGVKDTLRVEVTVPRRTHVRLTVGSVGGRLEYRRVDLGRLPSGTHTWTWDGRNQTGRVVPDQAYVIRAYDVAAGRNAAPVASEEVQVDTGFSPDLTTPTFGAGRKARARVYPRTAVVTDTLDLSAIAHEKEVTFFELVIRNDRGRVVRRADVGERLPYAIGGGFRDIGRTVSWAAVRGGKPLPRGRYTAVVVGGDTAGNTGRSEPLDIWVSAEKLEWRQTTTTLTAQASRTVGACAYTTANGCGEDAPCGEVLPSTTYAGGLSYRPRACEPADPRRSDAALAHHMLEVPEATGVRGLAAVRVSFVGSPTTAGEADTGTLAVPGVHGASRVVGTSGRSEWVDDPAWGGGLDRSYPIPQRDPAALWSFSTSGTSSVDVATFTVDVRYLAVAD